MGSQVSPLLRVQQTRRKVCRRQKVFHVQGNIICTQAVKKLVLRSYELKILILLWFQLKYWNAKFYKFTPVSTDTNWMLKRRNDLQKRNVLEDMLLKHVDLLRKWNMFNLRNKTQQYRETGNEIYTQWNTTNSGSAVIHKTTLQHRNQVTDDDDDDDCTSQTWFQVNSDGQLIKDTSYIHTHTFSG
jgi:hypothetical protein